MTQKPTVLRRSHRRRGRRGRAWSIWRRLVYVALLEYLFPGVVILAAAGIVAGIVVAIVGGARRARNGGRTGNADELTASGARSMESMPAFSTGSTFFLRQAADS